MSFAAWMPANRATSNGLPFGNPDVGDEVSGTGGNEDAALRAGFTAPACFSLTSTIFALPDWSMCVSFISCFFS